MYVIFILSKLSQILSFPHIIACCSYNSLSVWRDRQQEQLKGGRQSEALQCWFLWKAWGSEQLLPWWPGSRVTECQHKALRRQLWYQGQGRLGTQLSTCKAQSSDPAPQKKQENKKHKAEPHSSELLKGYFVQGFGAGHWVYLDSDGICWGLMHCSAIKPKLQYWCSISQEKTAGSRAESQWVGRDRFSDGWPFLPEGVPKTVGKHRCFHYDL